VQSLPADENFVAFTHVFVTLGLALANLILTQLIRKRSVLRRLRYVGHEMVYLAIGIELSKLLLSDSRDFVWMVLMVFGLLWLLVLFLTKMVIDADDTLNSLNAVTVPLGFVSVYWALGGHVHYWLAQLARSYA